MKNNTIKKIIWIGEHSFEKYKELNESVKKMFSHQVIRYTREVNSLKDENIVYLDEFNYLPTDSFDLQGVSLILSDWLQTSRISIENGIVVGDASELIFQSWLEVTTYHTSIKNEVDLDLYKFEEAHFLMESDGLNHINISQFDLLFLYEAIPFIDTIEKSNIYKGRSLNSYNSIFYANNDVFSINDFLFRFTEGEENILMYVSDVNKLN
jgi:hypothetical protein